nr:hypothetical protein [Methylomarinum sp. Ch1-1]MDP4519546.1 hypothetical protein [Methylomarinum sp. Ch1-1]
MKRIETRCAFYRQHTLPHRSASRSKPPKNRHQGKIGRCAYPGGLPTDLS